MCDEVWFFDGKTLPAWEAETQGELSRRLGGDLVRAATHAACELNPNDCLCPIDVPATATKFGLDCALDEVTGIYILRVPNNELFGAEHPNERLVIRGLN